MRNKQKRSTLEARETRIHRGYFAWRFGVIIKSPSTPFEMNTNCQGLNQQVTGSPVTLLLFFHMKPETLHFPPFEQEQTALLCVCGNLPRYCSRHHLSSCCEGPKLDLDGSLTTSQSIALLTQAWLFQMKFLGYNVRFRPWWTVTNFQCFSNTLSSNST